MNVLKIAIIATVLGSVATPVAAQSACKGLDEQGCNALELIPGVKTCRWVSYYTTERQVTYCRTSGKKVTKEQFEAIQARLNSATPAAEQQPAN